MRVLLACLRSILNQQDPLAFWAGALESQAVVTMNDAPTAFPDDRVVAGSPLISHNSDFVCVVDTDDPMGDSLDRSQRQTVSSPARRQELAPPCSDFWGIHGIR